MKTNYFFIPFLVVFFSAFVANANNMLVQNVTTLNDNPTAKTVQVQFDLSWDNSWRDSINWDAAWIFLKFKDANGLWQHAKLNTNGFQNGSGTTNTLQVTSDNVGAWVYRDTRGSGTFNSTTMQLQWNYGLSGLSKVTGLEVRVFAVEMVYVPEGGFMTSSYFNAGNEGASYAVWNCSSLVKNVGYPVLNERMTPPIHVFIGSPGWFTADDVTLQIKADVGIDTNNNAIIDITTYPTGFKAFYIYKYELTEQQYADFFNTLTSEQITLLGVAGSNISQTNNQYFSSTPNRSCIRSNSNRIFAYSDWSGLRPMSFWELQKAYNGNQGHNNSYYNAWITNVGSNNYSVSNLGITELTGNAIEPCMAASDFSFTTTNGDGVIQLENLSKVRTEWKSEKLIFLDFVYGDYLGDNEKSKSGFRYVRSAE